jgi:hypothetical protein
MEMMGRACGMNVKESKSRKLLVRKPERRRLLGRPQSRLVCSITIDFGETGLGGVDSIDLA